MYISDAGLLQMARISWERDAEYGLPVSVWRGRWTTTSPEPRGCAAARDVRAPLRLPRAQHDAELGARAGLAPGPPRGAARGGGVTLDEISKIADAVLYEGYVLWPYSKSATKNQRRWTFGGVYPEAHSEQHPDYAFGMQTECLLEGGEESGLDVWSGPPASCRARGCAGRGPWARRVEELTVGDEHHVSWDEATEREMTSRGVPLAAVLSSGRTIEVDVPAGETLQELRIRRAGSRARCCAAGERCGAPSESAPRPRPGLHRLTVRIVNTSPFAGDDRQEALRQTFCSAHTILHADKGEFVSLTDPPGPLRAEAAECRNAGTWPVLVGADGDRHTLLSSPIILPDYPQVAPESPGDMFDAAEIDQLLRLSILSMTDDEKRRMRASDPKTRAILERTESLSNEELMRLHGAVREFGLTRAPEAGHQSYWEQLEHPPQDFVTVDGVDVRRRSRVRLRPKRRADAFDLVLDGKSAIVEEVVESMEGRCSSRSRSRRTRGATWARIARWVTGSSSRRTRSSRSTAQSRRRRG